MKRMALLAFALSALAALAMPTQKEQAEAHAIVRELLKVHVDANQRGKESHEAVGDAAMALARDAKGEAAKFVLLKGAASYYGRGRAYEKAADAVEEIMAQIADVPPETMNAIVSKAAVNATEKNAPRLVALKKAVARRANAKKSLEALEPNMKKAPNDPSLKRMHAELVATTGDWKAALEEFATLGGAVGMIAADESANAAASADFWWGYVPAVPETKDAIKEHAAELYRQALANGELEGLKRNLAEQRIAEFTPVLANAAKDVAAKEGKNVKAPVDKHGPIHRWSFNGNLKDSVGDRDAKMIDGKVTFEKGQARIRPSGGYIDLGADVIPGGGEAEYTLEIWATKYSIRNYGRVFHILDNWSSNDYLWCWNSEKKPNQWELKVAGLSHFYATQEGGTRIGIENHFVIVYGHDEEKMPYIHVYILRNGSVYWQRQERLQGGMFTTHSAFWLGHSPFPWDEQADASYNEVRIWSRAFTHDEILRSSKLGPDRLP